MSAAAYKRLLDALDGRVTRASQAKAQARCPAHDDSNASLSVTAIDGQALVYCFAGCQTVDVLAALNLTMADLFDNRRGVDYRYDNGRVVHRKPDKTFPQSNADRPAELYQLSKVKTAVAAGRTIYVVGGEKDVHALETLGETATTNPMGEKNWPKVDPSPLYDAAKVVIIADRDKTGAQFACDVYVSLKGRVGKLEVKQAKRGKDAADHIAADLGVDDFAPVEDTQPDPFAKAISFAQLDGMSFPAPSYLVDKILPRGGITLLAGPPKIGKSYLALGVALAVAQNGVALGRLPVTTSGGVLFISLDDQNPARAQQRARQINHDQPLPPTATLHVQPNLGRGEPARDLLGRYLDQHPDTKLVVIDTLSHLRDDRRPTESIYDADVRWMATLRTLLAGHDCTFLCLTHTRKERADDGVQAISGTHGVTGGADALIVLNGNRHAPGRAVELISRDDEGGEFALTFTAHGLIVTDEDPHDPVLFLTPDDAGVYRALREFGEAGSTATELGSALGDGLTTGTKIGDRLGRMAHRGVIRRLGRGRYAI